MHGIQSLALTVIAWSSAALAGGDGPFAAFVESYDAGPSPTPGYTVSTAALGAPERFTGEGIFPSVVSPFSPAYGTDEIVSISPGGHLTLRFAEPVTDDPNNPFGIDLVIFGNVGLIDGDFPNAICAGVFSDDGGIVEVSADGSVWITVPDVTAEALMPAMGYLDSGAYDAMPGLLETNFTRPADPQLTITHLLGLDLPQIRTMYYGSGGGRGIDIATAGVSSITHVRVVNPHDNIENIEVDAVADAAARLAGDVNFDGAVNIDDLLDVIAGWGERPPGAPPTDFNNDGLVNIDDLLIVIGGWSGGVK